MEEQIYRMCGLEISHSLSGRCPLRDSPAHYTLAFPSHALLAEVWVTHVCRRVGLARQESLGGETSVRLCGRITSAADHNLNVDAPSHLSCSW